MKWQCISRAVGALRLSLQTGRAWFYLGVSCLWAGSLKVTRPLLWPRARVHPDQPGDHPSLSGRVLIVAPHPDDETLGAGGTAALHARRGDQVIIVTVTDGRSSQAASLSPTAMARQRASEAEAAAATLGVWELVQLGLPENTWQTEVARNTLKPLVDSADLVYGPSCVDFHPDHLQVARLLAELVRPAQAVRVYELQVPLTPLLANRVFDVRSVVAEKRRALACYATQQATLGTQQRVGRYRAALYGQAEVEVFWEMPGKAYRAVMEQGTWNWRASPFRGFRPRPFSDPLAFLSGWRMRRHLWERAASAGAGPQP